MKKLLVISFLVTVLVACNNEEVVEIPTESVAETSISNENSNSGYSKENAEANAEEFPPTPGRVLVTKGNHHFTGMPYYFTGELLASGDGSPFEVDGEVWLIKADTGYVMPINMTGADDANPGDNIEVWGVLSGEGWSIPNVDNVVGETGFMTMMEYSINRN